MIDTAIILTAGCSEHMWPLTDGVPTPLISVAGRSLLERSIDQLTAHGVGNVVVSVRHHLGELMANRLQDRATVVTEDRLLGSGGSVKNALPLLGRGPFFVLEADALRNDGPRPILSQLQDTWDPWRKDAVLLLHPIHKIIARDAHERGDYFLESQSRLRYRGTASLATHAFASLSVCDARLFEESPEGPFSLLELWLRAEAVGRLYGLENDDGWIRISTPEALAAAERVLAV
jgi:N-acetyl-alpha-D-muramate 1-phosphate uridylyltransferase